MTLLLGIDEGTSAVKAILFDAELRPVREARREKPLVHPRAGWVEHDGAVGRAGDAGTLRLGTVDSFLCEKLGAGFRTDPSTASRTQLGAPAWDSRLLEIFGVPESALPEIVDTAGDLGTLSHASWPVELPLRARCVDQQAALAGAGCVQPGLTKATYGTGVFVLAHVGTERPIAKGGLLPTLAW